MWGNEEQYFNCTNNQCRSNVDCGHYTQVPCPLVPRERHRTLQHIHHAVLLYLSVDAQVVWNTTLSVGCGISYCTKNSPFGAAFNNWTFVVCDYAPPGARPSLAQ